MILTHGKKENCLANLKGNNAMNLSIWKALRKKKRKKRFLKTSGKIPIFWFTKCDVHSMICTKFLCANFGSETFVKDKSQPSSSLWRTGLTIALCCKRPLNFRPTLVSCKLGVGEGLFKRKGGLGVFILFSSMGTRIYISGFPCPSDNVKNSAIFACVVEGTMIWINLQVGISKI